MTPDEQSNFAAILMAHEHVLTTLLAMTLKRISPEQRQQIEQSMNDPPDLSGLFERGDLDIGQADDIAGLALLFRENFQRIHRRAFAIVDSQFGGKTSE